jgi:4-amino-4-deoxy-L-arabinose transferase-like glycosyltransferase
VGGPVQIQDAASAIPPPEPSLHSLRSASGLLGRVADPVVLLIIISTGIRLVFAASTDLGVDESYMVAAGRSLQLSYYDHPPLSWWLARVAATLIGSESSLIVRLPFILLFALSTWLMDRLTADAFGDRAGFWAALLLNAAPLFGVTTASWVLPDGPLAAALLGAALCHRRALSGTGRVGWAWWIGAGLFAGLALLSKYTAVLTIAGAVLFMLTDPGARRWLGRPQPYVAAVIALGLFAPVIAWNALHHWASFAFQGGRAVPTGWHPAGPLTTALGQSLFLLPWIWAGLVGSAVAAIRAGRDDIKRWYFACLGLPPIVFFLAVSWRSHVMLHWAAPGYLLLFPLLGAIMSDRVREVPWLRPVGLGSAALTAAIALMVAALLSSGPVLAIAAARGLGAPLAEAVDWTSVADDLLARLHDGRPVTRIAAIKWNDCGKLGYALRGRANIICLGPDPRQFGFGHGAEQLDGDELLIVAPHSRIEDIRAAFGTAFESIDEKESTTVEQSGASILRLPVYLGHRFTPSAR